MGVFGKIVMGVIIFALVLFFLALIGGSGSTGKSIGDEITLQGSTSDGVVIYSSLNAHDKFLDAGNAKDDLGMAALFLSRELYFVDNGARARVLSVKPFKELYEVRILSGTQTGARGYVGTYNVRK